MMCKELPRKEVRKLHNLHGARLVSSDAEERSKRTTALFEKLPAMNPMLRIENALLHHLFKNPELGKDVSLADAYVLIGQQSLTGMYFEVEKELRRQTFTGEGQRRYNALYNLAEYPHAIVRLGRQLRELGAKPETVIDMLHASPLGERLSAFELISKHPDYVTLLELLQQNGMDAFDYMPFALDLADIDSAIPDQSIYSVVNSTARDHGQPDAAIWLIKHRDVWNSPNLEKMVELANSESGAIKVELFHKWAGDPKRKSVVEALLGALKPEECEELAELMPYLPSDSIDRVLAEPSLNMLRAQTIPDRPVEPVRNDNKPSWMELAYSHNPSLLVELRNAHTKLYAVGVPRRLRELDLYAREHAKGSQQESYSSRDAQREADLAVWANRISHMSDRLLGLVARDTKNFISVVPHLSDLPYILELEGIVKSHPNNPDQAADLISRKLASNSSIPGLGRIMASITLHLGIGDDSFGMPGVDYRVAVVTKIQAPQIRRRLTAQYAKQGITVMFVDPFQKEDPPYADAAIFDRDLDTHVRGIYAKRQAQIITSQRPGMKAISESLIGLVDRLHTGPTTQ